MLNRRKFLLGATASTLAGGTLVSTEVAAAQRKSLYYFNMETLRWEKRKPAIGRIEPAKRKKTKTNRKSIKKAKKKEFELNPKYEPTRVRYGSKYKPGTIVIETKHRYLYFVERGGFATRYGVAVGREGLAWSGTAKIKRKVEWPGWTPTANMIKREPEKYLKYKDGVPGGPESPLGARAMYLYKGKRDTKFRIHGTTAPWTIGSASSNGCIRMVNEHVIELYDRAPMGTTVVVI